MWKEPTQLRFNEKGSGSSIISEEGNTVIEATSIDAELMNEEITFIKMDIEGAELQALIGAEKTIIHNRPKLAISIYHKPEDLWQIPELILKYCPFYKLYIRHYALMSSETVLYALPY